MLKGPLHPDTNGMCLHCKHAVHFGKIHSIELTKGSKDEHYSFTEELRAARCPNCQGFVIDHITWTLDLNVGEEVLDKWSRIFPSPTMALASDIPKHIRDLFDEASLVRSVSDRAAAVLARGVLQLVLGENGFQANNLVDQIKAVKTSAMATPVLMEELELMRHIGNFAAHPTAVGNVLLDPEPGEVEALFGILEELFDAIYIRPRRLASVKQRVNEKLTRAGKKPIS